MKVKVKSDPGLYVDTRAQFLVARNNIIGSCLCMDKKEIEACLEEECLHFDMLIGKYRFSSTEYQNGFFNIPISGIQSRTPEALADHAESHLKDQLALIEAMIEVSTIKRDEDLMDDEES